MPAVAHGYAPHPPRGSRRTFAVLAAEPRHAAPVPADQTHQWELLGSSHELKPLHYPLRVLLTGIHLMRSGEVQGDLRALGTTVAEAPSYVGELMAANASGEHRELSAEIGTAVSIEADVNRLHEVIDDPHRPAAEPALNDLLIRLRLG